jgi:hypothetical protein
MDEPVAALLAVLQDYFDGLYDADIDKLTGIYHERVRLFCPTDPELVELDLPTYLEVVKNRPSPASRHDERFDRIVELSVPTATTAHARVECAYLPKRFTDDLTLVKTPGGWKIIAKVWHYEIPEWSASSRQQQSG